MTKQLYIVTWRFESSEDQTFALDSLIDYVESGQSENTPEGYERISWIHTSSRWNWSNYLQSRKCSSTL